VPIAGYFETGTKVPTPCPLGCSTCQSASKCTACQEGYTADGQLCKSNTNTNWLAIYIAIGVVSLFLTILFVVLIVRLCRRYHANDVDNVLENINGQDPSVMD
jgi:hypothetical protein